MDNSNGSKVSLGQIIKITRIKKKITQEDLCDGICTSSYLSRIENSRLIADDEIYTLLFQKLGMDYENFVHETNLIDEKVEGIYSKLLLQETVEEDLDDFFMSIHSYYKDLYIKGKLVYSRYLISKNKIKEAKSLLFELSKAITIKSDRNSFIYVNISVYLACLEENYLKAIDLNKKFNIVNNDSDQFNIYKFEKALFYYNIALSYCKIGRFYDCIQFTQKALKIFSRMYSPLYDLNCHILLGVAFNNVAQYERAITHYEVSLNILKHVPSTANEKYFNIIYCDLGYCYECQNQLIKAIDYYHKALNYHPDDVLSYINLIRCYYDNENIDEATSYLEKAIPMRHNIEKKYEYQIDIFSLLLLNLDMSMEEINKLQKESITYFKENRLYTLTIFYCELFANFYKKINWYKKASDLFEIALHTSQKLRKGGDIL